MLGRTFEMESPNMKLIRPIAGGLAAAVVFLGAACSSNEAGQPSDQATMSDGGRAATVTPTRATNTAVSTSRELTTAELVQQSEAAIVRIETESGVGSGFVVSADGDIITNNHVIEGPAGAVARSITVTLSDGDEQPAAVVGRDVRTDLALLRIQRTGLSALPLGDLDETVVGQDVVAIGYALDLAGGEGPAFSVTRGIISAKNRAIDEGQVQILGSIQTDAAINHGNSGGPLLNLHGEVVGVNTAIAPDGSGGVAVGIGFAVGVDTVKAVYAELLAKGEVNRGFLGIQNFEALREAKARELGISEDEGGVVLGGVLAGGPAGQAGLTAGDVLTRIGDTQIRTEADLAVALVLYGAGETVEVDYYRGSEKQNVAVTLASPE